MELNFDKINLFTQNSDLKKTGIFGWTLPAHNVITNDGKKFNVCPNSGVCGAFCYAKNGTYLFKNVRKAHLDKLDLVLNHSERWINMMNVELSKKKYFNKNIRVHDAGDFFSEKYAREWFSIMDSNKDVNFYAYTKEVLLFKEVLKNEIPNNFNIIYSFGGKQDKHIDKENDRHSDVFYNYDKMIQEGYIDIAENDLLASISPNKKIGLFRNNIKHYIKKMGDKNFSDYLK
jgi:hypothetical protein